MPAGEASLEPGMIKWLGNLAFWQSEAVAISVGQSVCKRETGFASLLPKAFIVILRLSREFALLAVEGRNVYRNYCQYADPDCSCE